MISTSTSRKLGPLRRSLQQSVPRLYDLCLNMLISPRPELPPLLDSYAWEVAPGKLHPLLDLDTLHDMIPCIARHDLSRSVAALRSAGAVYAGHRGKRPEIASLGIKSRVDPFPRSSRPQPPDDAAQNPYHNPCPSLYHPSNRRLFLHPAETRLEWRDVFGHKELPIRWEGCSPGCLDFLEDEDEDDWSVDGDEEGISW